MTQKKRKKSRRKAGRRKSDNHLPGWISMLMGLFLGLAVALYVYITDPTPPSIVLVKPPQSSAQPANAVPEVVDTTETSSQPAITFDFYDMLPNLGVEVYEDEKVPVRAATPARVSKPGIYILQAGSFSRIDDAKRRKAEMALLGIRADIKRGQANKRTVYRVYTDPMEDPAQVNDMSKKLQHANIEILLKRVSD
ncbi:MAG: SPOR domain-containing protein [Gammaproteobacteria bacterium]|nr:SPOR domain-containing protein [Gammaproteobacteria bacterium]MCP4091745.1 SPOR domain-containing protein [Gammaproteobacteria bacterium]MCP4275052.1 SPOR domain-containing protein [Gammaproteobacteria bacterium]MCP4831876.1 SPOR domain-containing protein [Gammaproteobacteria bacterium]MCP4929811.1 SPOR domain-containing protein [Gammaproteobacteria bacterium]